MNKFIMLTSVAAIALSASAFAHEYHAAESTPISNDFYATVGAGFGRTTVKAELSTQNKMIEKDKESLNSFTGMVGFGKQIDNNIRADVTADYTKKDEYKMYSVMANGYYHLDGMSSVSPYATLGLGYAKQTLSTVKKGGIAFQAGFGVSTKMSDKISLDLGYRFFKPKSIKITEGNYQTKLKTHAHKVMAAIRLPL